MDHKTGNENNLIALLDQTYPGANGFFDSLAAVTAARNGWILSTPTGMWTVSGDGRLKPLLNIIRTGAGGKVITSAPARRRQYTADLLT